MNDFLSGLGDLFNGFFEALGGGPSDTPEQSQRNALEDFFGTFPGMASKYGAPAARGHRAEQPWEQHSSPEPVMSLSDAVMAPFSGTSTAASRQPQASVPSFTAEVRQRTGPNMARAAELSRRRTNPNMTNTTRVARANIPENIATIVDKYATEAGVDPALARRIVHIESSGNPNAVTGSYQGLFQLSTHEFERFGGGNIFDPNDNARAGLLKLAAERRQLMKMLGRDVSPGELYLAHQQGLGGATKHLQNPKQAAWLSMAQTGEGRRKGEAWAKRAIWGNVPYSERKKFGSVENITSEQFVNMWLRKVEG